MRKTRSNNSTSEIATRPNPHEHLMRTMKIEILVGLSEETFFLNCGEMLGTQDVLFILWSINHTLKIFPGGNGHSQNFHSTQGARSRPIPFVYIELSYSTKGAEFGGFKSQIGISNNNNDLNASKWSYMASFTLRIPFHIKRDDS